MLTAPSAIPGVANVDFVIFPPRWMVATETFRPPYFHRNVMSEFMGLIYGAYDAKVETFMPGCMSIHNCMSAHGPDANTYHKAVHADLKPEYYANTLAFMFESRHVFRVTKAAYEASYRDKSYQKCWQNLAANEHEWASSSQRRDDDLRSYSPARCSLWRQRPFG